MAKSRLSDLTWLERFWLAGPVAIWFSYQPLMRLGQDSTSYYELSLTLIYVLGLALVGLPAIWRARKLLAKYRAVWLVGAFVALSWLSLFWTPNQTRGILTAGVIGLIFMIFLAALAERERFKRLLAQLSKLLVVSAVVVSLLALVQVIAGIWLGREETLLCAGCIADQFGFVRPNVFAIEPQFLGSLLLAPLLIVLNILLKGGQDKQAIISFIIIGLGLFLTLSRGAIFAFGLGALLLFVLNYQKMTTILRTASYLFIAFLMSLAIQGSAAALNPRVDVTFSGAVSAALNQLSLGLIDISSEQPSLPPSNLDELPAFDGYVPESTNTRLSLSRLALETSASSPLRTFFGVGLGGSGLAVHEKYPGLVGSREIVQNQYIETLLEYGLVGLILFAAIVGGLFYATRRATWLWAIVAAYLIQWVFFSGYPNALHIYLVLISLFVGFGLVSERRAAKSQTK